MEALHTLIVDIPNVGVLRYLKDPVSTLNELYARYPDGGEYGWFALCTDTNQFAVWSVATRRWEIKTENGTQEQTSNGLAVNTYVIDTGDFIPPNTVMLPFLRIPGSYGVVFTDPPISGLNDVNFNLRVDWVSHYGSGEDGDQDILQTLTTAQGQSYTRKLYHVQGQTDLSATDFIEDNIWEEVGGEYVQVILEALSSVYYGIGYFTMASPNNKYCIYYGTNPNLIGYIPILLSDLFDIDTDTNSFVVKSNQPIWDFTVSCNEIDVTFTSKILGVGLEGIYGFGDYDSADGNFGLYINYGINPVLQLKNNKKLEPEIIKDLNIDTIRRIQKYHIYIQRLNINWNEGWIKISTDQSLNANFIIDNITLIADFGSGTVNLTPIIHYPSAEAWNVEPYQGFYIRDAEGLLRQEAEFDFIKLSYDIIISGITQDTGFHYDSKKEFLGENVISDHDTGDTYHAKAMKKTFEAVYPTFEGDYIDTNLDPLTNNSSLQTKYTPKYCELKNANLVIRPFSGGAKEEQQGSNPNILSVASHSDNIFIRRDITPNAETFLTNTIAVGARINDNTTQSGASYGFGIEFFEEANLTSLNANYPDTTFPVVHAWITTLETDRTLVNLSNGGQNLPEFQVGTVVRFFDNVSYNLTRTVTQINTYPQIKVDTPLDVLPGGTVYMEYQGHLGTLWHSKLYLDYPTNLQPVSAIYEESPTCAIVAAKLKKIKMQTGASWQIVREAARATASNATAWDMYRGFGIINVTAAITYINTNYINNTSYRAQLAEKAEFDKGLSPFLQFTDLLPNTPVTKKMLSMNNLLSILGIISSIDDTTAASAGIPIGGIYYSTSLNKLITRQV